MNGRRNGWGGFAALAVVIFIIGRCSAGENGGAPAAVPATAFAAAEDYSSSADLSGASVEGGEQGQSVAEAAAADARASADAILEPTDEDETDEAAFAGEVYTDVDGHHVSSPTYSLSVPDGASAVCGDGTYSFSHHRRGTCSHHDGVAEWL